MTRKVNHLAVFLLILPALLFHQANAAGDSGGTTVVNQYGVATSNPYVVERFVSRGGEIDKVIVPGPPKPPEGFERPVANIPPPGTRAAADVILADVPAIRWSFGCSATAAAMVFGYLDRIGFSDMYTGPTDGGVFPLNNDVWPYYDDDLGTVLLPGTPYDPDYYGTCPLSATMLDLDERDIKGHVDDYWVQYGSYDPDPFIGNWVEHEKGDCTADFMGTNQYNFNVTDGSTYFYYWLDGTPTYDFTEEEPIYRDGCHGMRLFAESRGYFVDTNYSQYIKDYVGNNQGFSYKEYKQEIDEGRPVLIQVSGHTMVGVGYNDETDETVYIHDTWDHDVHTMTWGGSYSGMQHYGVTVIRILAPPAVATDPISAPEATSAVCGGNVTWNGGSDISARGVCWSVNENPTVSDSKTVDGSGLGSFTSEMTGLAGLTTYYVRAYATNSGVTGYGQQREFTTVEGPPSVTTGTVGYISKTSAWCDGNVLSEGGRDVTERGVCWSVSSPPSEAADKEEQKHDDTGLGEFYVLMTGLDPGTLYYAQAYATNELGTSYGDVVSFETDPVPPTVATAEVTGITTTSADCGGDVTFDGGRNVTARGVCWSSRSTKPTATGNKTVDGTGEGAFDSEIANLVPGTTYHVRAYATNELGTSYGETISFETVPVLPAISTAEVTGISSTSAQCGGNVTFDGGRDVTARGVCWSTSENPTVGSGNKTDDGEGEGAFTSEITGLGPGTTYYVRAYATNELGTSYGEEVSFETDPVPPTVSTAQVDSIAASTAICGGTVAADGGRTVTARGVCWSTSENPTVDSSLGKTENGGGKGTFSSIIFGMNPVTTYHVRAYATNEVGTSYGEDRSFTTDMALPGVSTGAAYSLSKNEASYSGTVTSNGGADVTARGVCFSTSETPTTSDETTDNGDGVGQFSGQLQDLLAGTTFYLRAWAKNAKGTGYGAQKTFTTVAGDEDLFATWGDEDCGGHTPCYPSISNAIANAISGDTLWVEGTNFGEDLVLAKDIGIEIFGGWDLSSGMAGQKTQVRSLSIERGSISIYNVSLKGE